MTLFGSSRAISVGELIARKKYPQAIEALKIELSRRPDNQSVRLQLADLLALAGRGPEAAPLLVQLADEFVAGGYTAKAIAVLKKLKRIDPERADVEERLADLIQDRGAKPVIPQEWQTSGRFKRALAEADSAGVDSPDGASLPEHRDLATPGTPQASAPQLDEASLLVSAALAAPAPDTPAPAPTPPPLYEEVVIEIDLGLAPEEPNLVTTPLFEGFSRDELVEVIRGLNVVSFAPGDVIVSEGEAGGGLFIVTTGAVKAFVREANGRARLAREMGEGDFFGEISLLRGTPRTATITAASACELLELDRATLETIAKSHPHVQDVLVDFYYKRGGAELGEIGKRAETPVGR